jgi:hypothetical protein
VGHGTREHATRLLLHRIELSKIHVFGKAATDHPEVMPLIDVQSLLAFGNGGSQLLRITDPSNRGELLETRVLRRADEEW